MKRLSLPTRRPAPRFAVSTADGARIALSDIRFRQDLLLVCLHGPGCLHCTRIACELVRRRPDWEVWGAVLLVLHSQEASFDLPFCQAYDGGGAVRRRYGGDAGVALAVIDRRGLYMEGWALRHPEPVDWREVAETVRWTAIQEPECSTCEVLPGWEQ
jgi:hypothetical protein